MMKRKIYRPSNKGFTLIEIFIVGALIALFAGMAIINIQQQFQNNLRKITIGETREIATALSFAYQDVSIFPKFCFLNQSLNMLTSSNLGNGTLPDGFDYIGYALTGNAQRVLTDWRGGYFAMAQTRDRISQGRGGTVRMYIPYLNKSLRWPADPWGNPYVLYLLWMDTEENVNFIMEPTQEPDFFCAVVSYGPNRVPGASGDPLLRLYQQDSLPADADYRVLYVEEYFQANRASEGYNQIMAPDSDDIFFEF